MNLFDRYQQALGSSSAMAIQTSAATENSSSTNTIAQTRFPITQAVLIAQHGTGVETSTSAIQEVQNQSLDAQQLLSSQAEDTAITPDLVQELVETGMDCDLVDLTSTERSGGEQPATVLTAAYKRPRADDGRWKGKALRIIRHVKKDGTKVRTELEISSPYIQKALRAIVPSYTFMNLYARPIVIEKPYASLFHCQKKLVEYAQQPDRTADERSHLELLTKAFYDKYLAESVRQYEAGIENGMVAFSHLWMLFQAGDDILITTPQYKEIGRIMDCVEEPCAEGGVEFAIYIWRWGHNAEKFGPCQVRLRIKKYSQGRAIDQLPYFPLKTLSEASRDAIQRETVRRGHRWRTLIKPSYKEYKGWVWVKSEQGLKVLWNEGRIMVDQQLYSEHACDLDDQLIGAQGYQLKRRGQPRFDTFTLRTRKIAFDQAECHKDDDGYEMTDDQALLAPARTKGFSMSTQTFAWFLVDCISEVNFKESAFSTLVMPPASKAMVRTLAQFHAADSCDFEDMVKGKGQGMVISLEGPPGSGKTLAAESVAELTHKPFYPVSTGALSTDPESAECALRDIFQRGERWNAAVLLDEADLFLAKRTSQELGRNALVNVFLRNLEYYQGLLFLTSNRVEEFDHAFDSRIHLHVAFDEPDATTRTQIWRHFIPKSWPDSDAQELGRELNVNGREIKNLMRTATLIDQSSEYALSKDLVRSIHRTNLECRKISSQKGGDAVES